MVVVASTAHEPKSGKVDVIKSRPNHVAFAQMPSVGLDLALCADRSGGTRV
jgi:hypothetical protein